MKYEVTWEECGIKGTRCMIFLFLDADGPPLHKTTVLVTLL